MIHLYRNYLFILPSVFLLSQYTFPAGPPSLGEIITNKILDPKQWSGNSGDWPKIKEQLKEKLKKRQIVPEALKFNGVILNETDLSGMDLRNVQFSGGTFIGVNFENCDLRGALFDDAVFKNVKLKGAILCDNFALSGDISDLGLIKQYSTLASEYGYLKNKEIKSIKIPLKKVNQYNYVEKKEDNSSEKQLQKMEALNRLFEAYRLDLARKSLKNCNLIGINLNADLFMADLQGANLSDANLTETSFGNTKLQNAKLSRNVTIPNYNDSSELFDKWVNGTEDEKNVYQKLINSQFPIIKGNLSNIVKDKNLKGRDLSNSMCSGNFSGFNLKSVNFEKAFLASCTFVNADLTNANLKGAILTGADFTKANLTNSNLSGAQINNVKLSDTYTLPFDMEEVQDDKILEVYKQCTDEEAKQIFKQILEAKKISVPE